VTFPLNTTDDRFKPSAGVAGAAQVQAISGPATIEEPTVNQMKMKTTSLMNVRINAQRRAP